MNQQINQLVKSTFQKENLEQCSLQELQRYAERHPYFGAAQLLLTKKMQVEHNDNYNDQLQKTFLFFNNPLWVKQLLDESGNATIQPAEKEKPVAINEAAVLEAILPPVASTEVVSQIEEQTNLPEIQLQIKKSQEMALKDELVFEPYHTVDYFASQGIKIKEEEKPVDKFGKQLKSFTDWLKTMKRLPITDLKNTPVTQAEQKVEALAENSLADRHVITESMAAVWEKQGNAQKAIEIYEKLSLLEPTKSAYFAARIAELKKQ